MGAYLSCFSIRCDMDTRSLVHVEDNHQNNAEQPQCKDSDCLQKKRKCPYPLPNDPAEIHR
jgi:hypothetical protein